MTACGICGREPHTVNDAVSECSHVDCPHRSRSWAVDHAVEAEPDASTPLDELFGVTCPFCGIRTDEPCDEPPIDTCERALSETYK